MISFENDPITDLVTTALQHQALAEFAEAVVTEVEASVDFTDAQKLAVRITTDRLVRQGGQANVQGLMEYVMNGDWTTGSVSVAALTTSQRETITNFIIAQAKSVLSQQAAALTLLSDATYTIPTEAA